MNNPQNIYLISSKNVEKAKLCYINTDRIIVFIKTEHIYSEIAKDVERSFDISNYEFDKPRLRGKIKKV